MHYDEPAVRGAYEPVSDASPVRMAEQPIKYQASTGFEGLNPMQLRVAEELLAVGQERPVADLSWATDLATWLDEELREHAGRIGPKQLWVTKSGVAGVLGCEARYAAKDNFRWATGAAKGVIVHAAIALAVGGSHADAHDLADAAFDEAASGGALGAWLGNLSTQERTTLVTESVVEIAAFLGSFPPLGTASNVAAEYPLATTVAHGKVRVSGRVDLAIGSPRRAPDGSITRRRILIETKTGRVRHEHRAEHLAYALLELLRVGVAPFRAATFYTSDATWVADDITFDLLFVAAVRLVDATKRLVELRNGREPTRQPGWRCGYCPLSGACPDRVKPAEWLGNSDADR